MHGKSLFFVVGRVGSPEMIVRAAGGAVVTRLLDQRRVLAVAPLTALSRLQRDPEIELAGPISIDAQRFGAFAQLIGLDNGRARALVINPVRRQAATQCTADHAHWR